MEEILKGATYHVLLAKDGNEAVEICRHTPIDLMITDMIMPQMEGIELIGHVRKQLPHLPIIAISGASSPDILSANLGVNLFLLKPFHPQQLTKAVRSIIG